MSVKLKLKVVPGSAQNHLAGWLGDAIKIKIKAQPENGKANAALEKFLAKSLGLSIKEVNICSGFTQANKIVEIDNMDKIDIYQRLQLTQTPP